MLFTATGWHICSSGGFSPLKKIPNPKCSYKDAFPSNLDPPDAISVFRTAVNSPVRFDRRGVNDMAVNKRHVYRRKFFNVLTEGPVLLALHKDFIGI